MTGTDEDEGFAEAAGLRIEQTFALCRFAALLSGKAKEPDCATAEVSSRPWIGIRLDASQLTIGSSQDTDCSA